MTDIPRWQYDEMKHPGVDYADSEIVARYDKNHLRFRDYKKDAEEILSALGLRAEHTVIDMGCGTGAFVLHAAPRCKKVYAVDVSAAMLEYLKKKAKKENLQNVEYHQGGFLTYEHTGEPVDAVVSVAALHHLPDFWKLVGLHRVADMIKAGGRLCLFDVVFPFGPGEHGEALDQWVFSTEAKLGEEFAEEVVTHIRDEYSTCDWILEEMLGRAGFVIDEQKTLETGPGTTYICTKKICEEAPSAVVLPGEAEGIRLARLRDAKPITDFDHVAKTDTARVQFIRSSIAGRQCYVYQQDDAVVAYAVLEYSFYGNGFVSMLYVHPERRRKGIGEKLMQHLESLCRTEKLFTSTNESNGPMRELLEKLGFQPSGRIEHLDEGDPELVYFKKLKM